jgi:eukaryotic-like serine/threonine-protein kinase
MTPSTLVGKVLLNRYHVESFVAAGGMGVVYKAWDDQMNVHLAMKVLSTDAAENPAALRRFHFEGEKLQQLKHPNIVPFYGLFQDQGTYFLLEGFINGHTLKEILNEQPDRRLPFSEALIYLRALYSALGYAHSLGVIHCDVKPANLMVDEAGNIFLTDFGIARHAGSMATTFAGVGTSYYMAPEQIQAGTPTPATDIYALGVMLFEMLTGQRPFTGNESEVAAVGPDPNDRIRAAQLTLPPPDPRSLNPDISPQVAAAILKAMRKNPVERFATTNAFLAAVSPSDPEKIPTRVPIRVPNWGIPASGSPQGEALPFDRHITAPAKQRKALLPGLFLALAGAAVLVLLLLWKGSSIFANQNQPLTPALTAPPSLAASQAAGNPLPIITVNPSAAPSQQPADTTVPGTAAVPSSAGTATAGTATASTGSAVPAAGADQWTSPVDGMLLIRIPAGAFKMGSNTSPWAFEAPEHTVTLDEFWIDQIPVTNAMFQKFVEATGLVTQAESAGWGYVSQGKGEIKTNGADWRHPTGPNSSLDGKENGPVVLVTWNEASQYCAWAGRRLPTEAEWEKAARGDDGRLYPWGNEIDCSLANYSNVPDTSYCTGGVTAVNQYPRGASPYGVLDMAGNTWDWVSDWYQSDYYSVSPSTNPTGPASGERRVHRGGAWYNFAQQVQVTYRFSNPPDSAFGSVGFRCGYSKK